LENKLKLNLECGQHYRNGYTNIVSGGFDTNLIHDGLSIVPGHYNNLDPIVGENKAEEIIFNPPLNTIHPTELPKSIKHWIDKLSTGGILKLWALDIRLIGKEAYDGGLTLANIHEAVFGKNNEMKSVLDTSTVIEAMRHSGCKIHNLYVDKFAVIIILVKNEDSN
jgi:hypothetical protein